MRVVSIRILFICGLLTAHAALAQTNALGQSATGNAEQSTAANAPVEDPLLRLLVSKGLLTTEEAGVVLSAGTPAAQRDRLALLLKNKGLISTAEFDALRAGAAVPPATGGNAVNVNPVSSGSNGSTARAPSASSQKPPTTPSVIAAVAPVRLLPIEPQTREGLIPDLKLGSGARIKPYGYFKTSVIRDSSSPLGNDFPLPLLAADTGPTGSPEFHLKARALRLGVNFEWLDPAPKTVLTGRFEFDFEGDFTRANNRNISSIRSSQPSLRLAWVRIDRRFNEKLAGFALFGQDWSPFASSTLPNMIENTNFGGIGFGAIYQRVPQTRFGFSYDVGGVRSVKIAPEFAFVFPAFGDLPANVADQLGYGERQGADSNRPGLQGRFVLQWQFDRAAGVLPAEFIVSLEHARRTAIVTAANVPAQFKAAFPAGAEVSSDSNAYSVELQLPTRFVTLSGKYYSGSDLRFFLGGQLLSNFNDTTGLTSTVSAPSIDGASTVVFGLLNGVPSIAPQRPVRGQGGFVQLGFPLSRLFSADPKGRNAGWAAYLYYGFDEALARDARRFSPVRGRSDLFSANLQYKLNTWVTLAFEQGYYRTRAANRSEFDFGGLPLFRGIPSYTSHNVRSEFATVFTF
ncbi:MAG: DcaP outer membrane protein [Acidobacteriota bacterium]|nr:DcaP outer membrane protein [Acidobacteriota bacterium]